MLIGNIEKKTLPWNPQFRCILCVILDILCPTFFQRGQPIRMKFSGYTQFTLRFRKRYVSTSTWMSFNKIFSHRIKLMSWENCDFRFQGLDRKLKRVPCISWGYYYYLLSSPFGLSSTGCTVKISRTNPTLSSQWDGLMASSQDPQTIGWTVYTPRVSCKLAEWSRRR